MGRGEERAEDIQGDAWRYAGAYAFVVPSSAPWAEETWGMRLGRL